MTTYDEHQATIGQNTSNSETEQSIGASSQPTLTLLLHPNLMRVGEQCSLPALTQGLPISLSRTHPMFCTQNKHAQALNDPRVSRQPVWFQRQNNTLQITPGKPSLKVWINGIPVGRGLTLPWVADNNQNIQIRLGHGVLLSLNLHGPVKDTPTPPEILGVSPQICELRKHIIRLAATPFPVLIRGENGVGKELVAQAIHKASSRANKPWVALNMAAIPISTASSELFGYGKGAFTGATQNRQGYFEQADGSTLFLDEIGETPLEIQPLLLRALESNEIQPLGRNSKRVDFRLITATDTPLESLIQSGGFRQSLLHRLQTTSIDVPPLRDRREDVPILLAHFLRDALEHCGASERLKPPPVPQKAWLGAELVQLLMAYDHPGNVRELKNLATEIAIFSHNQTKAALPSKLLERIAPTSSRNPPISTPSPRPPRSGPSSQGPKELTQEAVRATMLATGWNITKSAKELGVARNTLLRVIEKDPELTLPKLLNAKAIQCALKKHGGDINRAANDLKVSPHGLRLRMKALCLR